MNTTKLLQLITASSAIILGLVVMAGWFFSIPSLVQIHPSFVPMQFNTALGFLMIGLTLLFILKSRKSVGIISSVIVTTLGVLTLIQYIAQVNLGIDLLFIQPTIGVDPVVPGRIGANTAFCYSIIGITTLLAQTTKLNRCWIGMVGGIVLVLSFASLWGYLSDMPGLHGWGEVLSGMAVHTAAGLVMVGIALYLLYPDDKRSNQPQELREDYLFTPITATVPIIVLSLCVWQAMDTFEKKQLQSFTKESSKTVAQYLDQKLNEQINALTRMGQRWNLNNGTDEFAWSVDAENYISDYPGVQAVEWVDRTNHVRWVVPLEGNEAVVGIYSTFDSFRADAQKIAYQDRTVRATRTINLIQGGLGFLVYVPITADGENDGFLLGVIRSDMFLENVFKFTDFQHYILVEDDNTKVFCTQKTDEFADYTSDQSTVTNRGVHWDIRLHPKEQLINASMSSWPEAMLFIGLVFAFLTGLLVHMLQSSRDIRAHQHQLLIAIECKNDEIERQNCELSRSNTEMEEFTHTVSHDLKSPLVTIQGYAGFLKQDIANDRFDRVEQFANRIGSATQRMSDTISDLLELSRVGRGDQTSETINTRQVIAEVVSLLDSQIKDSNTNVNIQDSIPNIQADRVRTLQIFQNLITNAISYGQQEGRICEVHVGGTIQGNQVCLFVEDNGPGIEPEYHEKVFGLFQRMSSTKDGTGVGLAIVKRIASMSGGHAWVESAKNEGSTFFVTMPIPQSTEKTFSQAA
tara:strand:- start:180185 stop:182422 length:2238 start_codon:yes stop_codon:yes gene_type:complete